MDSLCVLSGVRIVNRVVKWTCYSIYIYRFYTVLSLTSIIRGTTFPKVEEKGQSRRNGYLPQADAS
jgi:hypothetical protein